MSTQPAYARRSNPLRVEWVGSIGRITIDGVLWAAVEWSETRQARCIGDAEGHCLGHRHHIPGKEADKDAAVMLAMIRDGRMPTPAEASQCRKDRLQRRRQRPSEQRRRQHREKEKQLLTARSKAEREEFSELPLCEVLADAFVSADPGLSRSNSFASLRPRLISYVEHAIAVLEFESGSRYRSIFPAQRESGRLQRALEIRQFLKPKDQR
jgi:hypothetical protein